MKPQRSNSIGSPGVYKPEDKQTIHVLKRKYSTAMQLSKIPGTIIPDVAQEEPKLGSWSYLKRNEPSLIIQAILDLAETG